MEFWAVSTRATSHGHSWTRGSVCSLLHQYDIAIHRPGERAERQEATINEAATALSVSTTTIRRLIANGTLPARQLPTFKQSLGCGQAMFNSTKRVIALIGAES